MKDALKRLLSMVTPYRAMRRSAAHLDAQYRSGTWDYLWSTGELARFSVLAGYCRHLRPGGSLLEIGSGEGILQERLDRSTYRRYVGVDVSETAIARARERCRDSVPSVEFVVADAASYSPAETFDLVLFNESLEYFDDPVALVQRYEAFLAAGGMFIASIYRGRDAVRWKRIWRRLERVYETYDQTTVTNAASMTWDIKVLVPRRRA